MVGALLAPSPTSAIRYLATKCINRHRVHGWLMPWGSNRCQQFMLAVLQFDIAFKMINQIEEDVIITIDAVLAHRDDLKCEWTTARHSVEQRPLRCTFSVPKTYENEGRFYHCDPRPIMQLGSVAHKYFLINLCLPVNDTVNVGIGEIKDINLVGIHQNGSA
ncbi:hypothetical protein KUCAC02_022986 [Chaenocephalus aceratus]|uniref:Uncharacterized protein n=1 Tax=Chaenocephalus aceratus TaxID=36190 RepID=A0ACB9XNS0_CHAAC|nr:hypothetical protein KUCAC02_022986 [Chaenocephalus aceratus]